MTRSGAVSSPGVLSRSLRVGVVADTHGLFDPDLYRHFAGVDCILHAGDIGDREVIRQLERIATVTAVSGNVDGFRRSGYPAQQQVKMAGLRIALRHVVYEGGILTPEAQAYLDRVRPDICIFGHTHRPFGAWHGSTLLFNPGSAGPRRFRLPRACGLLELHAHEVVWSHVLLRSSTHN